MKAVFIDNYDSFAHTIAAYFEIAGKKFNDNLEVKVFKSDCCLDSICDEKPDFLILGPGPNSPKKAGNYLEALKKFYKQYPIFGICLGFQAIMHYFGEPVVILQEPVHGASSPIIHNNRGIFRNIKNPANFARYHSLGVYKVPEYFESLAYYPDKDGRNIIMAAKHKELPIAGVQFHPESVLSTEKDNGMKLIENVIRELVINAKK